MRKLLSFVILLGLTSCGGAYKTAGTDKYIAEFEKQSKKYNRFIMVTNLIVEFVDVIEEYPGNNSVIGVCLNGVGTPIIKLRNDFWNKSDEFLREELMFHELGHCILNKEHTIKPGIMSPGLHGTEEYLAHRDEWIKEYFE